MHNFNSGKQTIAKPQFSKMGKPDLTIAGLRIWIKFDPEVDEFDPNWGYIAITTVHSLVNGSVVWFQTGYYTGELTQRIEKFLKQYELLYKGESETGKFDFSSKGLENVGPNLFIKIYPTDRKDQFDLEYEISPEPWSQEHKFHYPVDKYLLPSVIEDCKEVLKILPHND